MSNEEYSCRICGLIKPITEYYTDKKRRNGHFSECKECCIKKAKERYVPHPRIKKPPRNGEEIKRNHKGTLRSRRIECAIIERRVCSENPETYEQIASTFGVSRQRVHQIARQLVEIEKNNVNSV